MEVWHITVSTANRMPLVRSETQRRKCVRHVIRLFGRRVVVYSFVDDHGHLVFVCTEAELGEQKRALARVLPPLVSQPLAPLFARRVESRAHLMRLIPYSLGQTEHHRLSEDPALFSGSCFQDLIGARCLPGGDLRLWEHLPRLRPIDLLTHVGLPRVAIAPADDATIRTAGAARVAAACAAAVAAPPDLAGRSDPVVDARLAAIAIGDHAGITRAETAWALRITPRAVRRLATRDARPAIVRAARVRLALENACTERSLTSRKSA